MCGGMVPEGQRPDAENDDGFIGATLREEQYPWYCADCGESGYHWERRRHCPHCGQYLLGGE